MIFTGVVEITVGTGGTNNLVFKNQNYSTSIHEQARYGTQVIRVELENQPAVVTFSFASGNDDNAFTINSLGRFCLRCIIKLFMSLYKQL